MINTISDLALRNLVLATYHSWCTSEQLLKKLLQRYEVPVEALKMSEEDAIKFKKDVGLRVALVLKAWMLQKERDFSDRLLETLREFIEVQLIKDGRLDLAKTLRGPFTALVSQNIDLRVLIFIVRVERSQF